MINTQIQDERTPLVTAPHTILLFSASEVLHSQFQLSSPSLVLPLSGNFSTRQIKFVWTQGMSGT